MAESAAYRENWQRLDFLTAKYPEVKHCFVRADGGTGSPERIDSTQAAIILVKMGARAEVEELASILIAMGNVFEAKVIHGEVLQ